MLLPRIGRAERVPRRHEKSGNVPFPEVRDGRAGWGFRLGRTKSACCGVIMLTTSLITAYGSGGSWVDVAFPVSPEEFESIKKDPKQKEGFEALFARATCSQAGKAYTGEMRYGKGGVQVKCK